MNTFTISRIDDVHESFADVARAANGHLVCTYKEQDGHGAGPYDLGHLNTDYPSRLFPIDYDRSIASDYGYSGWVQLSDGDIYAVQYIVDDAPKAQIRGYRIQRSDWLLFPEGELGWEVPHGDFSQRVQERARERHRKNLET